MAVNSKQKGGRFERTICKWFTNWTGYEFNRVPASGGLRWKNAENITSDVACTDQDHSREFNFSIECKSYKELNFEHILLEKKSCKILSFWEQARRDAERAKKLPMLIMKYNGMTKGEAFVLVGYDTYNICILPQREKMTKCQMGIQLNPKEKISPANAFYILMLSDLKALDYKLFHKAATILRGKGFDPKALPSVKKSEPVKPVSPTTKPVEEKKPKKVKATKTTEPDFSGMTAEEIKKEKKRLRRLKRKEAKKDLPF